MISGVYPPRLADIRESNLDRVLDEPVTAWKLDDSPRRAEDGSDHVRAQNEYQEAYCSVSHMLF